MKYSLQGGQLPVVVCTLDPGEAMFTQNGGMSWMSEGLAMETNMEGGLLGGLARKFSGESMFMTTYTAQAPGIIAFASSFPGTIMVKELGPGESIIAQKRAFLAATRTVTLATFFQRKLGAGLVGGEGFIMQKITGPGVVFLEIDGASIEYDLQSGQTLKVDTGHVAVMTDTVSFDITTVKGFKNVLFGGEGLFLTTVKGPGHVWLQSMPTENMARSLIPFLPSKN